MEGRSEEEDEKRYFLKDFGGMYFEIWFFMCIVDFCNL